jgi:hypothetical protein
VQAGHLEQDEDQVCSIARPHDTTGATATPAQVAAGDHECGRLDALGGG